MSDGATEFRKESSRPGYRVVKRALDLSVAIVLLLLLGPLMLFTALIVRLFLGSPVLFRQVRPGWRGKAFTIFKFRTMTDRRDVSGRLLPDSERLTRVGRFIRSTSLDELPQLFNVLQGNLSLVGPRPLLFDYIPLYTAQQARRHEVKPGITGWAQVNGRNALTWEQKFEHDVWYVDHCSISVDLKILMMTFVKTVRRSGIEGHGNVAFTGSRPQRAGVRTGESADRESPDTGDRRD